LGDAPDLKFSQQGKPIGTFSLAVNERWKDAEGSPRERVEWFKIVCFDRLAEVCGEYLNKGKFLSQAFDKCLYRKQEFIESKEAGRPDGWSTTQFSFT
jgi:hypothetical protein